MNFRRKIIEQSQFSGIPMYAAIELDEYQNANDFPPNYFGNPAEPSSISGISNRFDYLDMEDYVTRSANDSSVEVIV